MRSVGQNISRIDLKPRPVEASIGKTPFTGNAAQAKFVTSPVDCLPWSACSGSRAQYGIDLPGSLHASQHGGTSVAEGSP